MLRCLAITLLLLPLAAGAAASIKQGDIEWGAQRYSRNGTTNTAKGVGDAWVRQGDRTVRADQIEVDFTTNRAVANGNVHIIEAGRDIWCSHLDYNLHGEDAVMENMKMFSGSVVITGAVVHKLDNRRFDVDDGTYSNCNVDQTKAPEVTQCAFDWKVQGRRFSVTMGEYAHFYDVLVFAKNLPVFYTPYLLLPVKSGRQTGLLMPTMPFATNTGQGFNVPFFWAMGDWHDLTLTPTFYSKYGLHLGGQYRYLYSPTTRGSINFFLLSRKFLPAFRESDRDSEGRRFAIDAETNQGKLAGLLGEGAIDLTNDIALGGRVTSKQTLRLMSSPIYNYAFPADLAGDLGYLRSQLNLTVPGDEWVTTARLQHFQSLVIPENPNHPKNEYLPGDPALPPGTIAQGRYRQSDYGAVTELPTITVSKTNAPVVGNFLTYEADFELNNFYRRDASDPLPLQGAPSSEQTYFLRTGRRLRLEPRLVASIPLPSGLQLQPVLRAGTMAYGFDYPNSRVISRGYSTLEVPFSFYLSRTFDTAISGYEKISHVFQPRVIFGSSLWNSDEPTDPFFLRDRPYTSLPNTGTTPQTVIAPRFDFVDQVSNYSFVRFELINRLRRWTKDGNERFFLLQVSEQYNMRTERFDPRYQNRIGPIELLAEAKIWQLYVQVQALYQLQKGVAQPPGVEVHTGFDALTGQPVNDPLANPSTNEYDLSTAITYLAPNGDSLRLSGLFTNRVDSQLIQQTVMAAFTKKLPTFFDIDAAAEYSLRQGVLISYSLGFLFQAKPRSCWYLSTRFGTNGSNKQPFFNLGFSLNFGSVGS